MKDQIIKDLILKEKTRQENVIELIASENIVSQQIMDAMGSILTNKYAEGYPYARYYGGCEFVDEIETIAQQRACELFKAEHANVQPHSGTSANLTVYRALLNYQDTILAMSLDHGGHLTHGHRVSFSGKDYHFVHYGVDETDFINYDQVRELALIHRPKLIIAGASAYSRIIDFKEFRAIANEVGAYLMADICHYAGLIAAEEYPNPFPHAHIATTTTHKTLRGPRGAIILCQKDLAKKIDSAVFPGFQGGPLMHTIAAKAMCFFEAMQPEFKQYIQQVKLNAKAMSDVFLSQGMKVVSRGTDSHLFLLKLENINGKEFQNILDTVNITVNKNTVPRDVLPPQLSSGIRIGTPSITTRKMKEKEATLIGQWIFDIYSNPKDSKKLSLIKKDVLDLCTQFPIPIEETTGS